MFPLFERNVIGTAAKTSARRRSSARSANSLRLEGLEERVVYSATAVSVPAEVSILEGSSYNVPITRTGDLSQPLTVNYKFSAWPSNHQDISRSAYTGTVTLNPGVKTFTLSPITAVDDKIDENDDYFYLDIAVAGNSSASVSGGRTVLTIKDNDAPPNVSIVPLVTAKNEDGGNVYFRVSLDAPSEKEILVYYKGQSTGTFTWGKDAVFADSPSESTNVLIFAPSETQKDIVVSIKDDKIIESNEVVQVALTSGRNINGYGQVKAEVTIRDNDVPTVVVDDAGSIYEGNTAGATANFKVRVLEAMERAVHVKYWTAAGDANSTSDYFSKSGTLIFGGDPRYAVAPSQQTVSVALRADAIQEVTAENFYLGVGPIDSTAANRLIVPKTYGKATIVDDDAKPRTIVGTPTPTSAIPTPENGFGMVQHTWSAASNAARYQVYVRKENSFFSEQYYKDDLTGQAITKTTFSPIYTSWLSKGTYLWQVRAIAADGTEGAWSSPQRFEMPERWAAN